MKNNLDISLEKCWTFAQNSKSEMRFGAFIEKNGRIIGYGYNHHPTKKERRNAKHFHRKLDYCIHAEEHALLNALKKIKNLEGAVLYVAGFIKNGIPVKKEKTFFTCERCVKNVLLPFNLPVRVPTVNGWKELSPKKAHDTSLNFKNTGFWGKIARGK